MINVYLYTHNTDLGRYCRLSRNSVACQNIVLSLS